MTKKALTYGTVAGAIALVYVAIVVLPLSVLGVGGDGPGLLLPIVAIAVTAVLFEPIRARAARLAARLVGDERVAPHDVLSQLTARLSVADEGTISELAQLVADGTAAHEVVMWQRRDEILEPVGGWALSGAVERTPATAAELVDDECTAVVAVRHGPDVLGAITISKPTTDPISTSDRRLLADVAASSGLLLRHFGLNDALRERAEELRRSRRRLIAAEDAERQRLERDLHDGAQQHIVALRVKLGVAEVVAHRGGEPELVDTIAALSATAQEAVESVRTIAQGIYPALLDSEGLAPALLTLVTPTAQIEVPGHLPRFPRSFEETVYFCVREVLERVPAPVEVRLEQEDDSVRVGARHSQPNDPTVLLALADRVHAVDGSVELDTSPHATHITISIPVLRDAIE